MAWDQLQPGDLITYSMAHGSVHIAFYSGGGKIVHAVPQGNVVERAESQRLQRARRVAIRL